MQLVDRIEKRRFVGREFLLFLWFESEIFEGTLSTKKHGEFGMFIEGQLVLSAGREQTRIKGTQPAFGREAKESLARGKLPELAGLHLSHGEHEQSFVLRADTLGVRGLRLGTVLGDSDEPEAPGLVPAAPPKKKRRTSKEQDDQAESDMAHEAFYERMSLTRGFEAVLAELYGDFLALRLSPAWEQNVLPYLSAFVRGKPVDADRYRKGRDLALGARARRRSA
jgi:hypothetical protein